MKNVLLATTALVASAGIAAAEVTITGFAEIGVFDPGDDDGEALQFHTDIDATLTMSTETDSGLSFGASIDLDESDTDETLSIAENESGDGFEDIETGGSPAFDNALQGGESIFVSGPFGTLTMGDTDGAFDFAMQEAIIGSAINDDHEHAGYSGNSGLDETYDGQIARYEYAFGDFSFAVSGEIDDDGSDDPVIGIGATYSTAFGQFRGQPITVGLGVGYQTINDIDFPDFDDDDDDDDDDGDANIYGVSADIDLAGIQVILNYSDGEEADDGQDVEHFGIAVGYTFDALTVAANYGRFDRGGDANENDELEADDEGYGLIVNYDLGGGAEAQFGYANNEEGDDDFDTYSAGLAISF
jgi:outer membrane protein OmpU